MEALAFARPATATERDAIQAIVDSLERAPLPAAQAVDDDLTSFWLPRLGAPERLFAAYTTAARERLTSSTLEAADHDLAALALAPGLTEAEFKTAVASKFSTMAAIETILEAARSDITDAAGADLVRTLAPGGDMSVEAHWQIVREWLTYFLRDKYEIAPQSFITRLRPGASRE